MIGDGLWTGVHGGSTCARYHCGQALHVQSQALCMHMLHVGNSSVLARMWGSKVQTTDLVAGSTVSIQSAGFW